LINWTEGNKLRQKIDLFASTNLNIDDSWKNRWIGFKKNMVNGNMSCSYQPTQSIPTLKFYTFIFEKCKLNSHFWTLINTN
jgi:hypothetical protein